MAKSKAKSVVKNIKESILVFSAHSDDFVIGVGGAIAKYSKQKVKVHCVVFSYGENSHPWEEADKVKDFRSREAFDAAKTLGCSVEFFDLKELQFKEDAQVQKINKQLLRIIKKHKPTKIFTHSSEDPHPDHQAVNSITKEVYEELRSKPQVLTYSVWNPVEFKTRHPALIIPIKDEFKTKIKALGQFPSQRFNAIYPLMFFIWFKAIKEGFRIRSRFAEKFYLIRKGDNN